MGGHYYSYTVVLDNEAADHWMKVTLFSNKLCPKVIINGYWSAAY